MSPDGALLPGASVFASVTSTGATSPLGLGGGGFSSWGFGRRQSVHARVRQSARIGRFDDDRGVAGDCWVAARWALGRVGCRLVPRHCCNE